MVVGARGGGFFRLPAFAAACAANVADDGAAACANAADDVRVLATAATCAANAADDDGATAADDDDNRSGFWGAEEFFPVGSSFLAGSLAGLAANMIPLGRSLDMALAAMAFWIASPRCCMCDGRV